MRITQLIFLDQFQRALREFLREFSMGYATKIVDKSTEPCSPGVLKNHLELTF